MINLQVHTLTSQQDPISVYDRSSELDYRTLCQWVLDQRVIDKTALRVCDVHTPSLLFDVDLSIYLDHEHKLPIELVVIITELIISQSYDIIILDGLLVEICQYFPRLRWILSIFDRQLVIFRD